MSKLATYFKESVSVLKKGFAYARGVPVLLLALIKRLTGDGFYEVSFTKIGRKWYCNVPGFPKELFEHTLMVGGAAKFLKYYSRGESEIKAIIKIANEKEDQNYCGMRLYKTQSTLTGGAFYKDPSEFFTEEIWFAPSPSSSWAAIPSASSSTKSTRTICTAPYISSEKTERNTTGAASRNVRHSPWCCLYIGRNPFAYSSRRFTTRRRRGLSSRFLASTFTPASSGSTRIRPQYSHTMIFLRVRISSWRWGGTLLKQPPQASR